MPKFLNIGEVQDRVGNPIRMDRQYKMIDLIYVSTVPQLDHTVQQVARGVHATVSRTLRFPVAQATSRTLKHYEA